MGDRWKDCRARNWEDVGPTAVHTHVNPEKASVGRSTGVTARLTARGLCSGVFLFLLATEREIPVGYDGSSNCTPYILQRALQLELPPVRIVCLL